MKPLFHKIRDGTQYDGAQMETIEYPGGKAVKFGYQYYDYNATDGDYCHCGRMQFQSSPKWGVASKTVYLDGDLTNLAAENLRTWSFTQTNYEVYHHHDVAGCQTELGYCGNNGWDEYKQTHTMTAPSGEVTIAKFRTPVHETQWAEYGELLEDVSSSVDGPTIRSTTYDYTTLDSNSTTQDAERVKTKTTTTYLDDKPDGVNPTTMVEERLNYDIFGVYGRRRCRWPCRSGGQRPTFRQSQWLGGLRWCGNWRCRRW